MLSDALNHANTVFQFDTIINNTDYLELDDSIYTKILFSNDKELQHSKHILSRIEKRDLYKLLWSGNLDDDDYKTFNQDNFPDINPENIKHVHMKFNLCNGIYSPLENVKFSKSSYVHVPNSLSNGTFEENTVMIYSIN